MFVQPMLFSSKWTIWPNICPTYQFGLFLIPVLSTRNVAILLAVPFDVVSAVGDKVDGCSGRRERSVVLECD
jgi:hypothetical protein